MASTKQFISETNVRVYDNRTGDCVQVGPDADIGELVEIRMYDDGKIVQRIAMEQEQAVLVAQAILRLYGEES